ncbi:MAG: hypothetical protein K6T99_09325 [Armatimonadetes bacterium]|nr:hypothetical protein [Armatimonadota bacterium]
MEKYLFAILTLIFAVGVYASSDKQPQELRFKDEFLRMLVASVPDILKDQDPKTGRFGKGIWIVNDQNIMFSLAVAWALKSPANPYYHDPKVLEAVVKAGDALIAEAKPDGQWEFRKKDGSTWGNIYMPWTYSAWIMSYGLVREGMTPSQKKRWDDALIHGYTGISQTALKRVHNIPTHHAMGLYIAGQVFDRPEWCKQAKEFMAKVVAAQDPAGFWSENCGPVVGYGNVYTNALGIYYAVSHDETVLPAIERAIRFHTNFTYPDGTSVETVDERTPYHRRIRFPNVAFTLTPEGRGYVLQELNLLAKSGGKVSADSCASFLMYGQEGPVTPTAAQESDRTFITSDGKSLIRRKGPWFICLSAYHCPIPKSRWLQDRQNLVSIFHDNCGLIVGGGNTKLQPLWSTFTVGDISLLKHKPGDENPNFMPEGQLFHVPSVAGLKKTDPPGLGLVYGEEKCSIEVEPVDASTLKIRLMATNKSGLPVAAHLTLIPHIGKPFRAEKMAEKLLGEEGFTLSSRNAGGWIAHAGWKLSLPEGSSVTWPVLPHNPYRKDGSATIEEGRIVVTIPFSPEHKEHVVVLQEGYY